LQVNEHDMPYRTTPTGGQQMAMGGGFNPNRPTGQSRPAAAHVGTQPFGHASTSQQVHTPLFASPDPSKADWSEMMHDIDRGDYEKLATCPPNHSLLNQKSSSEGRTPLMIAAIQGKNQAVSILLAKGADPTLADHSGTTGLAWAARFGNVEVANKIMSMGKHTTAEVDTCLEWAARNGQPTLETFLNTMGSDPRARPAVERAIGQA
jgi:hypothetical protein